MSECRDRQVGTAVRALGSPSVQWTVRHCRWLPGWVAEALLVGWSWAVEKKRYMLVTTGRPCRDDSSRGCGERERACKNDSSGVGVGGVERERASEAWAVKTM